jgi:phosphatidylethanolamine-binding protein (PEBP) family uncharacterized protein
MRIIRFVLGVAVLLLGSSGCGDDPLPNNDAPSSLTGAVYNLASAQGICAQPGPCAVDFFSPSEYVAEDVVPLKAQMFGTYAYTASGTTGTVELLPQGAMSPFTLVFDNTSPAAGTFTLTDSEGATVSSGSFEADLPEPEPDSGSSAGLQVTSSSFTAGGTIGSRYTCDGVDGGVSPALAWTHVDGAECYAVIMDDATASDFVHWNLWGISPLTEAIPENSTDGTPGFNGFGNSGYGGPCPPGPGSGAPPALTGEHDYTISVFGLTQSACDQLVDQNPDPWTRASFRSGFASQILDEGQISFTYAAPPVF